MARDHAKTPTDDVLNRFLQALLRDRQVGELHDADHYADRFPEIAEQIQAEFARFNDPETIPADPAPALESPFGPGATLGPYRLLSELGRGGQGAVYLAEDERLGRQVAVKLLPALSSWAPELRRRFEREARIAASLDHPGLCPVYDADEFEGVPFVVMRHVAGQTLGARLAAVPTGQAEPMGVLDALRTIELAARALHAAHEAGFVHRDVKPGNLMLEPDGNVVVLDFGLARELEPGAGLTQTGDLFGTPRYMAPEQIESSIGPASPATDVWALGATLFEALCSEAPFESPTREGLYRAILTAEPRDPLRLRSGLPKDLRTVIATALAKEPERRYVSARALAEDLRRIAEERPILARATGPLERTWLWAKRAPLRAALVGGLIVTLATATGLAGYLGAKSGTLEAGEQELERQRRGGLIADTFEGEIESQKREEMELAMAELPEDALLRTAAAFDLLRTKNPDGALALLDAAPATLDQPRLIARMRAYVLTELEREDEALAVLAELGEPLTGNEYYLAALIASKGTDPGSPESYTGALELAQAAVIHAPTPSRQDLMLLTQVAVGAGRLDLSRISARALTLRFPDSAKAWYYSAVSLSSTDAAGARAALERTVKLDPEFPQAHLSLALQQRLAQEPHAADASYERCLACQPDDFARVTSMATWSRVLRLTGDPDGALAQAERALALLPDSAAGAEARDSALAAQNP